MRWPYLIAGAGVRDLRPGMGRKQEVPHHKCVRLVWHQNVVLRGVYLVAQYVRSAEPFQPKGHLHIVTFRYIPT